MSSKQLPATKLTANDSTAKEELGRVRWENNKAYKYVVIEDLAVAVGDVVEFSDTTGYEVTQDRAGGSSVGRVVAGVAIGTITDAYYGWIQVHGRNTGLKTDGGVSAGDILVPHATQNGHADTGTDVTTGATAGTMGQGFAQALADDSTSASAAVVVAEIRCL